MSTLTRWPGRERDASEPNETAVDLHAELKRLRRENAVLKHLSRIRKQSSGLFPRRMATFQKKPRPSSRGGRSVKLAFIDAEKASFPISRMCRVLDVSQSGFFAWQGRPVCRRQQRDMVYLTPIRTAFALSNGTYGSPRMHL